MIEQRSNLLDSFNLKVAKYSSFQKKLIDRSKQQMNQNSIVSKRQYWKQGVHQIFFKFKSQNQQLAKIVKQIIIYTIFGKWSQIFSEKLEEKQGRVNNSNFFPSFHFLADHVGQYAPQIEKFLQSASQAPKIIDAPHQQQQPPLINAPPQVPIQWHNPFEEEYKELPLINPSEFPQRQETQQLDIELVTQMNDWCIEKDGLTQEIDERYREQPEVQNQEQQWGNREKKCKLMQMKWRKKVRQNLQNRQSGVEKKEMPRLDLIRERIICY